MNLEQFFSFDDDILPLIIDKERTRFRKNEAHPAYPDLDQIKKRTNAHIVGQLNDDVLLFTWDNKKEMCEKEVTFFCLYNLATKKSSVLFEHDRKVDVVTASVNEERTLLAFTVIELKSVLENPAEKTVAVYKSFIAEISPRYRVYTLDIQGPQYQQVEFLYGKFLHGTSAPRESHMLFFHHTESIDLYHIPLVKVDGRMIMSGHQPLFENLVKGFVWAQLDRPNKRLYYVYQLDETKNDSRGDSTEVTFVFSAIQLCEKSSPVFAVNMPCPFPINSPLEHSACRFHYDRKVLTNIIAESHVNMQVVSSPDGSFFLCYQHPPGKKRTLSQDSVLSNEETDGSVESESQETVLEYSVLMCHHGSVLKCKIPNVIPQNVIDGTKLTFAMFYDCIAVILPGYVFHLLDCNAHHPPCNHLILPEGLDIMELPPSNSQPSEFVCINGSAVQPLKELHLFEPSLCKMFKMKTDNQYWADCFVSTHRESTRLALLHFTILHIQDEKIISQIFSHVVHDPANLECLDILKEYLLGWTYFQIKSRVESSVYQLLPFSNTEPFRGQLEMNRAGKKIARISYSSIKTGDIFVLSLKEEKRKEMEFWGSLKRNVTLANSVERFSLKKVAISEEVESPNNAVTEDSGLSSIFKRLRRFPYVEPYASGNAESFNEYVPEFLEFINSDPGTKSAEERKSMQVLESLTRYLHHYLPPEIPKLKIQNMAMEYTRCQKKQSSHLLTLFWRGLKYTEETHPYDEPLSKRGSNRDCALLMLLERYHVAVKELRFPFPIGFHAFLTTMGFRCLEQKLFIQYVTNGVFVLESDFMHRLLEAVGKDDSYSPIISRLIASFEQSKAVHFLKKWNSPNSSRLLCRNYVSNLLNQADGVSFQNDSRDFLSTSQRFDDHEKTVSTSLNSLEDSPKDEASPFRPLVNFISSLEATVSPRKKLRDGKGSGNQQESRSRSELQFIARHAMQHTTNQVGDSLGLVAF